MRCFHGGDVPRLEFFLNNHFEPCCWLLVKFDREGNRGISRFQNAAIKSMWEMYLTFSPDIIIKFSIITEGYRKGDCKFIRWKFQCSGSIVQLQPQLSI